MNGTSRQTPAHIAWLLPAGVLFLMCGILLGRDLSCWQGAAGVVGLGGAAVLCSRRWQRFLAVCMICLGVGAQLSYMEFHPQLPPEGMYAVTATVADEITVDEAGQVQTLLTGVTLNGEEAPDAYWTFYLSEEEALPSWLAPGQPLSLQAEVYHPAGRTNPGGFDFREYLMQKDVRIGLYGAEEMTPEAGSFCLTGAIAALRHKMTRRLNGVMGPEEGGYAAAMLLGVKRYLPDKDEEHFRRLGVAHILSISGFHVGLLAALLRWLLRPLDPERKPCLVAEAAVLSAYAVLTGGSAPVIRAGCMVLWREYTRIRKRQILPLHMICVTAALQLIFSPAQLFGASFQLSYGAVLGILLVTPRLRGRITFASHAWQKTWEAFCLTLGAQLGVLLPQLYWFGELPVLALLLNMVVIPFAGVLICLYWLTLLTLPVPGLGAAMGKLAAAATQLLTSAVRWMGQQEAVSLWTRRGDLFTLAGWLLLLWGLSSLIPRRLEKYRRAAAILGALLLLTIFVPLPQGVPSCIQFDEGDADAALVKSGGMTILIDAGEDGQAAAGYLHQRRQGVDALFLTHLHTDHGGGISALTEKGIPVEVCYLPSGAQTPIIDEEMLPLLDALAETGTAFRYLRRGDEVELPGGRIRVLWPPEGHARPEHDANDVCLVLQAQLNGTTLLFSGDLPELYSKYAAPPSDILKAPHHGSKVSCTQELLRRVQPRLILLSNKDEGRHANMTELAGGIPLYATNRCGAVTLIFPEEGIFTAEAFCTPAFTFPD